MLAVLCRRASDSSGEEDDYPAIKPGSMARQPKHSPGANKHNKPNNRHQPQSPQPPPGSSKKQKKRFYQQLQQQRRRSPSYSEHSGSEASEDRDKPRYKALDMSATNEAGLHAKNSARAERFGDGTVGNSGRAGYTPKVRSTLALMSCVSWLCCKFDIQPVRALRCTSVSLGAF